MGEAGTRYVAPDRLDQPLWDALRSARSPSTIAELQSASGGRSQNVTRRLRHWSSLGLAEEMPGRPTLYRLRKVDRSREKAPTQGELSQTVWTALRRLGGEATFAEIVAATGESDRAVYCRLFRWLQIGYLQRVPAEAARFALTAEGLAREAAPRKLPPASKPRRMRTQRARIWVAMRILGEFDVPLLMMTAEADRRPCEELISALGRAGYVRTVAHRMRRHKPGASGFARSFTLYRLVRNTGPKCPIIACPAEGGRRLIDRNNGESIELVARQKRSGREAHHGN